MGLVIYILAPLYETRYSRGSDIYYNNVRHRCKAYVLVWYVCNAAIRREICLCDGLRIYGICTTAWLL